MLLLDTTTSNFYLNRRLLVSWRERCGFDGYKELGLVNVRWLKYEVDASGRSGHLLVAAAVALKGFLFLQVVP